MNVKEMLVRAFREVDSKNYDAALKILKKIKRTSPNERDAVYLEARIYDELKNYVKEYHALKNLLPLLDTSTPEGRKFASEVFLNLGIICNSHANLRAEALKMFLSYARTTDDKIKAKEQTEYAIFLSNALENYSAADFQKLYDEYKKKYLTDIKSYPRKFYSHEKIRIGFLSGDFRFHAVVSWSWSLLRNLDKNRFEKYFYSSTAKPDVVTEELRSIADGWCDIRDLTDKAVAKLIRDDEIDILFDLAGYTPYNRLSAATYRPASVQMSGVGYMNSTGLDCFDYFLSDVYCAGNPDYFTEKLIILPHSHICYEPTVKFPPASEPPCLKNKFVTFGSFNQFGKITDSILIAWKKILDAVPNSRLILKHKIYDDDKNFLIGRLKKFGFDLERVELRGYTGTWLSEYADIDIALDTFPYTGGVTTCEALYMGVPVISLYGDRHGSRFGLSILKNVGLDELAVDSYDEYISRAVELAGDWELLTILRKNLRGMMKKSPLMDSDNYIREIQDAFIQILNNEQKNFLSANR